MLTSLLERLLDVPAPVVLVVVGSLVFIEDALFFGFVVPGETVAILGGVAASLGHVPLWAVLTVVLVGAIVGDSVGFEVGRRYGPGCSRSGRWSATATGSTTPGTCSPVVVAGPSCSAGGSPSSAP